MDSGSFQRAIPLLFLLSMALGAQALRGHDPTRLANWPAPLYWQAPQAVTTTNLPSGAAALLFVAMPPCRVVDTRSGQGFGGVFGPPSLAGGMVRTFPLRASANCPIPAIALAYSLNVTAIPQGPLFYLTVYAATANPQPAPPDVSTLNALEGNVTANAAIVAAGTDGEGGVDVYASGPTDLLLDINGYYVPPGDLAGNTALGTSALANNTTGWDNTANGFGALEANTIGGANTALGWQALTRNTTGTENTATGNQSLWRNTTGNNNTANGYSTLFYNTTGTENTALGYDALYNNSTGNSNTATGAYALNTGTTGSYNTADGSYALYAAGAGSYNTSIGYGAGQYVAFANYNIAIGYRAGSNVFSGNGNNIHIGNIGVLTDNGVIRIGTPAPLAPSYNSAQTAFFAAGIRGVTTGNNDAMPVVIDSAGQLGTVNSSARFKEDIRDMGEASSGLLRLRPVTFRYRQPFADGSKPVQFGLIAEEVEKVYPELVTHSADGQIESVKYQALDSLLLNEVRKQAEEIRLLKEQVAALKTLLGQ